MQVRELVEPLIGSGDWRCSSFGAGKFSETYIVRGSGKAEFVLRIAPPDSVLQLFYEYRMMRQEPGLHELIRSQTTVPIPEIVAHDFSRVTIDRDFLIMPRIPGLPLNQAGLTSGAQERAFKEWGRYVAALHEVTDQEDRFGYLGAHNCMQPQPSWMEAFTVMFQKELKDIVNCGVYTVHQADDILSLLGRHEGVFAACEESRLCHGDLWVTNLLVEPNGRASALIDFDRACWGDAEWDLAIAEYCGVTRPSFWEGYGSLIDTHSGEAGIRRFFYLLYEHQKYIVISMSSRRDSPSQARRYAGECLQAIEAFRKSGIPAF